MVTLRPHGYEQEQLTNLPELVSVFSPCETSTTYGAQVIMRYVFGGGGSFCHNLM
jgi:hypothetical protein